MHGETNRLSEEAEPTPGPSKEGSWKEGIMPEGVPLLGGARGGFAPG